MKKQKYVYVVFSSTPCKMGKMIRKVTGDRYNHVALSLDPELKNLYSFARRYRNAPFYGGFIRESSLRYLYEKEYALIKVCSIPVNDDQIKKIGSFLFNMNLNCDKYLYNMISAFFTPFGIKKAVKNAYTCVEFAVELLSDCGLTEGIDKSGYYSLTDLQNLLSEYVTYEGSYFDHRNVWRRDTYITRRNIAVRTVLTVSANARLIGNLLINNKE